MKTQGGIAADAGGMRAKVYTRSWIFHIQNRKAGNSARMKLRE